jgi:molybdopterin converting factor small subunit
MPSIQVRLPSLLEPIAGTRSFTVDAPTASGAIEALLEAQPGLRVHLYDERRNLRPHVRLFWNDRDLAWLDGEVTAHDGDVLTIMQAVSGG